MKGGGGTRVVLVTCGTLAEGRRIARQVVSGGLAACANIVLSPVESIYTWKGSLEKAREYLVTMKTTSKRLAELEREVKRFHSYDVPEFISIPITEGSRKYLSWLEASVLSTRKKSK